MRPAWLVPVIAMAINVDGCHQQQPTCKTELDGSCVEGESCSVIATCPQGYQAVACTCSGGTLKCSNPGSCSPTQSPYDVYAPGPYDVSLPPLDVQPPPIDVTPPPLLDASPPPFLESGLR